MPSEIRHITFQPVEVVLAIREYRRCRRRPLPSGFLSDLNVVDATDGSLNAVIRINPDGGQEMQSIIVDQEELTEALILFCIESGIPLPAAARKMLRNDITGATLVMTLDQQTTATPHRALPIPNLLSSLGNGKAETVSA